MTNTTETETTARPSVVEAATALILETFRLNGRLLAAGDRLVGDLGLTSARWQVLGAIEDAPLPVAQIARDMGLTRQSVQRLADVLEASGLVEFAVNPNHRRAKLVALSNRGRTVMAEVDRRQQAWAARIAGGLGTDELTQATQVAETLRRTLEAEEPRK